MPTVELTSDQIDQLIIDELKLAIQLNLSPDKDESGHYLGIDEALLASLKVVLSYYMPPSEYKEYIREIEIQEVALISQMGGDY